jgi:hypothetical protein
MDLSNTKRKNSQERKNNRTRRKNCRGRHSKKQLFILITFVYSDEKIAVILEVPNILAKRKSA